MKKNKTQLQLLLALLLLMFVGLGQSLSAQNGPDNKKPKNHPKTDSPITYHNGPIMHGATDVYFIWYGCWDETCQAGNTATQSIIYDFIMNVGGSPYFQINAMYPNGSGGGPSGALLYAGDTVDRYSHGLELTAADMQEIVKDAIESNRLPQDPASIYLVIASADVSSPDTGFCEPGALPHHGVGEALGSAFRYAFVGNALRCPSLAAPQFRTPDGTQLPTPNGNLAADAMVSTIAHLMNVIVTNPYGNAWFDRYGLENADKCIGEFGPTYLVNGGRANIKLGQRDYLIQQNWINEKKGHCAMNSSL
jgi:hypothetical protein